MPSVAPTVVVDTATLSNFAVVGRLNILDTRLGHRIAWTDQVEHEIQRGVPHEAYLADVIACEWLGDPVQFDDPACLRDIMNIRSGLASPRDPADKHLGEAECIHYIEHELGGNGCLLTDDAPARDFATRRGIALTMDTHAVLAEAFAFDELQCPEPYDLLVAMRNAGRMGVRVPDSHRRIC